MDNPTQAYQVVYIYLVGIRTIKDGMAMTIFAMDAYNEYAFEPVIVSQPKTDHELQNAIKKIFDSIYKAYDPVIHFQTTTFITNLPEEIAPLVKNSIKDEHQIIFDEKETKNAVQPMIKSFEGFFGQ